MTGFCDLNLRFPGSSTISVFMSSFNFMLSRVEHEKSFITFGPGVYFPKDLPGQEPHLIIDFAQNEQDDLEGL